MKTRRKTVAVISAAVSFVFVPPVAAWAQSAIGLDFIPDVWNKVQAAGPFATLIMLYLWTRSEAERRKLQDERDGLLERTLNVISANTESNRDLRIGLFGGSHERE